MGKNEDLSQAEELGFAFGRFLTIFIGSLVLGAILALVAAFILKRQGTINEEEHQEAQSNKEELSKTQQKFQDE